MSTRTGSYGTKAELAAELAAMKAAGLEKVERSQFGRTLQAYRLQRGLSLTDFARLHDCSHQAVTILEMKTKSPTIATVEAVCKTLGVSLVEFFAEYMKHHISLADRIAARNGH